MRGLARRRSGERLTRGFESAARRGRGAGWRGRCRRRGAAAAARSWTTSRRRCGGLARTAARGSRTLEELFSGSRAAEHSWPLTAAERAAGAGGAGRAHARAWADGRAARDPRMGGRGRAGAAARAGADRRRAGPAAARRCGSWRTWSPVACPRCGRCRGSRRGESGSRRRRTTRRRSSVGCSRTCKAMTEARRLGERQPKGLGRCCIC